MPDSKVKEFFSKEQSGANFLQDKEFSPENIEEYLRAVETGEYIVVVDPEDLKLRQSQMNERDEAE